MPNLAMRQPGTQFSADGLDLSWPIGGEREVVAWPDENMTLRIRRRIAEGQISITDDAPTKSVANTAREYRLLTGEEARKHFLEPAGPVTRVVYEPGVEVSPDDYQREVQTVQDPSARFIEAQAEAMKAAEERSAEIAKRQVAAEKAAAKKAAATKDDEEEDPLAERLRRTEEASAEWHAQREADFMEREKARQKLEAEYGTIAPTPDEDTSAAPEPDTTADDEAVMAAEKVRQAEEKKVEAERKEAAEAAEKAEASSDAAQKAVSEPTPVKAPTKGPQKSSTKKG